MRPVREHGIMKQMGRQSALVLCIALLGIGVSSTFMFARNSTPQLKSPPHTMGSSIDASSFAQLREQGEVTVVDVRTQDEFNEGHLPGALHLDFYSDSFKASLAELDRETPYAIYCRSGNRSKQTVALMRSLGFSSVVDMSGGIIAWQAQGGRTCTSC